MKKTITCIFVFMLCLSLSACKSEAATNADNLIIGIGEVTLASEDKIIEAEEAVNALKESHNEQYQQLEQLPILEKARASYDELVMQKEIEDEINSIGEVTLDSENKISAARELYDAASEQIKEKVSNYAILDEAEKDVSALKIEEVTSLINDIGDVTLEKEENIKDAQNAYNLLSVNEKANILNSDILNNAISTLSALQKEAKEKAAEAAIAKMKVETDKVEGRNWYFSSANPKYANSRSYVLPYIGEDISTGSTWLRLKFVYTGDNWVLYDKITIMVDGTKYYKNFDYYDVKRDNGSGDVWEIADISPSSADIQMLKAMAESTETIVRFEGDEYRYDLTVSSKDKTGIKDVLAAYESIKIRGTKEHGSTTVFSACRGTRFTQQSKPGFRCI